jgi:lipoate-protein ligase B
VAPPAAGLSVRRLGRVPYGEALALQARLQAERIAGAIPDTLLLLEHPDVITFGAGAKAEHALPEPELRRLGYEVFRTNRGGEVTWHGPGQLVGYPIVDLAPRGRDLHRYLRELEQALARALGDCGIRALRREGYTGVWIDARRKVASLGVGVRRWVTMHGFALNVTCDLARFGAIVPCGLADVEMTSVAALRADADPLEVECAVEARMREAFA